MDSEFWIERWQRNEIGFHQIQVNPYLKQFWSALIPYPQATVFVPLCGRSQDMVWLQQRGHSVLGVELSLIAVQDFFVEQRLVPTRQEVDGFVIFESPGYKIYCGDYFALKPRHLGQIAAVYDRASLVALPPPLRIQYAQHMVRLTPPDTRTLLVAIDYPAEQMAGPPFAVSDSEIRALYGDTFTVQSLRVHDALQDNPRFIERGLTRLDERVYSLRRLDK